MGRLEWKSQLEVEMQGSEVGKWKVSRLVVRLWKVLGMTVTKKQDVQACSQT